MRPCAVVHGVGIELGLEREAVAGFVCGPVLCIAIVEPVARVEVRARRGDGDVEHAPGGGVLGVQRRTGRGVRRRVEPIDAQAVVVAARPGELVVGGVDVAAEGLGLAEVEGRPIDGAYLAHRDVVGAQWKEVPGVHADGLRER